MKLKKSRIFHARFTLIWATMDPRTRSLSLNKDFAQSEYNRHKTLNLPPASLIQVCKKKKKKKKKNVTKLKKITVGKSNFEAKEVWRRRLCDLQR